MALSRKIWYDRRLIRGNAMSSQPIISGIRKFPKAAISTGMATQKIMMLPCMVTSALYFPGVTIPIARDMLIRETQLHAENVRQDSRRSAAIAMPVNKYCMAIILWSVDQKYL